jgi:hypothetical protein
LWNAGDEASPEMNSDRMSIIADLLFGRHNKSLVPFCEIRQKDRNNKHKVDGGSTNYLQDRARRSRQRCQKNRCHARYESPKAHAQQFVEKQKTSHDQRELLASGRLIELMTQRDCCDG